MVMIAPSAAKPSIPLNASADPEFNALSIGPVPPVLGTDTDAARQFYRTGVSQLRMSPLPAASKIAVGAQAQTQIITQIINSGGSGSSAIDLQVNNVDNPVQGVLNLTGGGVSYGPGKGQVQISANVPGTIVIGPGFALWQIDNDSSAFMSDMIPGPDGIGGNLFYLPTQIKTTQITFNVSHADAINSYDIGIYGPFTGVETTLPLLLNVGPVLYSSNGNYTELWLQGSTVLAPGYYFLELTTSGSPTLILTAQQAQSYLYPAYLSTVSGGSTLPATITAPTASPTVTTGSSGSNIPATIAFILN